MRSQPQHRSRLTLANRSGALMPPVYLTKKQLKAIATNSTSTFHCARLRDFLASIRNDLSLARRSSAHPMKLAERAVTSEDIIHVLAIRLQTLEFEYTEATTCLAHLPDTDIDLAELDIEADLTRLTKVALTSAENENLTILALGFIYAALELCPEKGGTNSMFLRTLEGYEVIAVGSKVQTQTAQHTATHQSSRRLSARSTATTSSRRVAASSPSDHTTSAKGIMQAGARAATAASSTVTLFAQSDQFDRVIALKLKRALIPTIDLYLVTKRMSRAITDVGFARAQYIHDALSSDNLASVASVLSEFLSTGRIAKVEGGRSSWFGGADSPSSKDKKTSLRRQIADTLDIPLSGQLDKELIEKLIFQGGPSTALATGRSASVYF